MVAASSRAHPANRSLTALTMRAVVTCIFVTINYRLRGFGYLLSDRDPASANLGLLD
jgi:carboxylesterase type B